MIDTRYAYLETKSALLTTLIQAKQDSSQKTGLEVKVDKNGTKRLWNHNTDKWEKMDKSGGPLVRVSNKVVDSVSEAKRKWDRLTKREDEVILDPKDGHFKLPSDFFPKDFEGHQGEKEIEMEDHFRVDIANQAQFEAFWNALELEKKIETEKVKSKELNGTIGKIKKASGAIAQGGDDKRTKDALKGVQKDLKKISFGGNEHLQMTVNGLLSKWDKLSPGERRGYLNFIKQNLDNLATKMKESDDAKIKEMEGELDGLLRYAMTTLQKY
jgi:hypothetical protein